MATVTGYTAERMQEIEDAAIVDGHVDDNGDLILTRHDDTEINAGSLIGPAGPDGPPGPTSIYVGASDDRPVDPDRFEGLGLWETDTKLFYIWNGAEWVYSGGTFVCTSLTRPVDPFPGMEIYEEDTSRNLVYQSATTGWTPPWNVAWGIVGYAAVTAPQSGITGVTDATGLSLTRTFVANRGIKVRCGWGSIYSSVAGDAGVVSLKEGATILNQSFQVLDDIGGEGSYLERFLQPTAGAHTYKVTYERLSGTGSITVEGAAHVIPYIMIEDIGPLFPPV